MTDEQARKEYYESQGLNCNNDVGRSYWLRQAKGKVKRKSGLRKLKTHQLKIISNKEGIKN